MTTLLSTTSYMDYKFIDLEKMTTRALDAVSISFRVNISFSVNRVTLKKKRKNARAKCLVEVDCFDLNDPR